MKTIDQATDKNDLRLNSFSLNLDYFYNNIESKLSLNDISFQNQSNVWSFHTHLLLLCSSIITIYYLNSVPDTSEINRSVDIIKECYLFVRILSRLPTNVHGINRIKSNDKMVNNVRYTQTEQRRLGYGLFFEASAMNHDCRPNCSVKYYQSSSIESEQLNHRFATAVIEIVSIATIKKDCELTISYGPLYGVHSWAVRQQILSKHYQFTCRCSACLEESLSYHHDVKRPLIEDKFHTITMKLNSLRCDFKAVLSHRNSDGNERLYLSLFSLQDQCVAVVKSMNIIIEVT
jgi:hypothetical protein